MQEIALGRLRSACWPRWLPPSHLAWRLRWRWRADEGRRQRLQSNERRVMRATIWRHQKDS